MATEQKNDTMTKLKMNFFECDICGENCILKAKCPFCDFFCCQTCFNTYILTTPGDTKCMNTKCNQVYDMDTVWKLCSTKAYKEYVDFKHEQMIQKELSLSQETLVEIEQERIQKKANEIFQLDAKVQKAIQIMNSFQLLVLDMNKINKNITQNMVSQLGMNFENILNLNATKATKPIREEIAESARILRIESSEEKKVEELKKSTFIKNCSVENCKGTLNQRWYCRLCETPHCNKCGELKNGGGDGERKNEEHVCDPNLVQSLEEIKKNSKACPKCGVSIFKTEGCDQMFCIVCHTAFSWTTLNIETGRIHNPHYYEILRKNGEIKREDGDVRPCDEDVRFDYTLIRNYERYGVLSIEEYNKLEDSFRFVDELAQTYNERREQINNYTFSNIRKKFLKNEITNENFRKQIKSKHTKVLKKLELCRILSITKIAISEELKRTMQEEDGTTINRIISSSETQSEINSYIRNKYQTFEENITKIIENTNNILEEVGCKYPTKSRKIVHLRGVGWKIDYSL